MKKKRLFENIIHGIFLILGLITIGFVLLITVYLIISGIPAIREIGLFKFLFGKVWAGTAAQPSYGILPFILTSIYGTAGAIVIGVPIGFMTAVYLAKLAPKQIKSVMESAVSLLAGIPSVVYGLVGMIVLVPAVRALFHLPDGASLFAAIIVLAVMILPSIIKVSITALEAVPKEYEDASLALGATPVETYFRGHGGNDGSRKCSEYAVPVWKCALSHNSGCFRNVLFKRFAAASVVFHCPCIVSLYYADKRCVKFLFEAG